MSNQDKPAVVATRWWWVRHAPVRGDGGNIYGQTDIACDTGDREVFEAVAKILPRNAVWYASSLMRTHQTADAIWAAGFPKPSAMPHVAAFAEQHLGQWQGMNRAAFLASRPVGSSWFADIDVPARGLALGGEPAKGLAFDIDNCSVTRLDHFAGAGHANWRLPMVNQQPWIADIKHAAMHQPAGPEVVPETKLA